MPGPFDARNPPGTVAGNRIAMIFKRRAFGPPPPTAPTAGTAESVPQAEGAVGEQLQQQRRQRRGVGHGLGGEGGGSPAPDMFSSADTKLMSACMHHACPAHPLHSAAAGPAVAAVAALAPAY